MENKTLNFYEMKEWIKNEDQSYMSVFFKYWYNARFNVVYWLPDYMGEAEIEISNSDLQELWKAIIERLKDTPYKII